MTSRISRPAYGTDFSTILNKFWTDFLKFSAKDGGGVSHPPTPPPNVRPCLDEYQPIPAILNMIID